MFLADLADKFWLDLALAAVLVTHRKPNFFIFYIILPERAMSNLAHFRSANHWLSDSVWATSEKGNSKNERKSVSDPGEKIEWRGDSQPQKNERVPSSVIYYYTLQIGFAPKKIFFSS